MPNRLRSPLVILRRRRLPKWVRTMDAVVGHRINRRHAPRFADVAYRRLSRAADRGVLWFLIAGALIILGRHRAGLRGVASLTIASILANLIGKRLFGGDRPLLKDIPVGRRLKKSPTSGSFPSGHAASAAAFATGVALESPMIGAGIAPIAAGVAYSRLHVGAHWFSDVIGGVVLGAAVAVLGKVLIPAPRSTALAEGSGKADVPDRLRVRLPPAPTGAGVLIVLNPKSGTSVVRADPEGIIRDRLPEARVHVLGDDESLADVVAAAAASASPPIVLGVCGGDGTVAAMAQLAREHGLPLLGLPGGTFNHFLRTVGVESIDAAITALEQGDGVRVDVAELRLDDDEAVTVLNAGSVGIYPDLVAEREKHEKRLGKWLALIVAARRVLRKAEPVDVELNGKDLRVWSLYAGIDPNLSQTVAPLRRHRLDGGLLDVRVLHARTRLQAGASLAFGRRTSTALRGMGLVSSDGETRFTMPVIELTVHARRGESPGFGYDGEVSRDGEPIVDRYVARMRVLPGGLEVYSPQ